MTENNKRSAAKKVFGFMSGCGFITVLTLLVFTNLGGITSWSAHLEDSIQELARATSVTVMKYAMETAHSASCRQALLRMSSSAGMLANTLMYSLMNISILYFF